LPLGWATGRSAAAEKEGSRSNTTSARSRTPATARRERDPERRHVAAHQTRAPPEPHRASLEPHDGPGLASLCPALPQTPARLEPPAEDRPTRSHKQAPPGQDARNNEPQAKARVTISGHDAPARGRRLELEHVKPEPARVGPRLDVSAAPAATSRRNANACNQLHAEHDHRARACRSRRARPRRTQSGRVRRPPTRGMEDRPHPRRDPHSPHPAVESSALPRSQTASPGSTCGTADTTGTTPPNTRRP
jgi:hypothetical protein